VTSRIPNHFHFVWLGSRFPLVNQLAIESVLLRCEGAKATLWHTDDLSSETEFDVLRRRPGFFAQRLDARRLRDELEAASAVDETRFDLEDLVATFEALTEPAGRANVARLVILWRHGGVYLDLDTLTLRDFAALREHRGFIGRERIIWPHGSRDRLLYRLVTGQLMGLARNTCARWRVGLRVFPKMEGAYPLALNNAMMGFEPRHPFLAEALGRISEIDTEERRRRYRLGTHLVQEVMRGRDWGLSVRRLPPGACYPLGPVMSRHYFTPLADLGRVADRLLGSSTAVHWYASLAELSTFDQAAIEGDADRTLFGRLCAAVLAESAAEWG